MKRRIVLVAAATIGLTFAGMAPSYAGVNGDISSTWGSTAKFFHDGDEIKLCDTNSDGFSVFANYRINGGTLYETQQFNGGEGNCGRKGTGNPPEGADVGYCASVDVEGGTDPKGAWKVGIA